MPQSVFDGLALEADDERIRVWYPDAIHGLTRAMDVVRAHGLAIRPGRSGTWMVECLSAGSPCPVQLKSFFAELNGFPGPVYSNVSDNACGHDPLVSCIVIVNENSLFVREQLVPSLVANSGKHPVEIILVYNGAPEPDRALAPLIHVRSAWGAVSSAYNAGARTSRGEYLALFHDDCIMDDPQWIEKCIDALTRGVDAVAGEYRRLDSIAGVAVPGLPIAKCVPLFMRRSDYFKAGGYDEFHYVGYEDLDFTLALICGGRKLSGIQLRGRHFNGMSSTLKYCPVPGLAALYGLVALPRETIMQRFREFAQRGIVERGVDVLRMALDAQLLYVLRKYESYLRTIDGEAYRRASGELERRVAQAGSVEADLIVPYFRDLDRRIARVSS